MTVAVSPLPGTTILNLSNVTALDGTESVPLVQGGTTKRASTFQIADVAGGVFSSVGLSVIGRSAATTGLVAPITGTANQVLRVAQDGSALVFGPIDLPSPDAVTGVLLAVNGAASIQPTLVVDGSLSGSTYTVLNTDTTLLIDCSTAINIQLLTGASRNQVPLAIKDISGAASTNAITILPSGSETIDGASSLPIAADYGGWILWPRSGFWNIAP